MAYIYKSPNSQASEINPDEEEQLGPVQLAGSSSVGAYLDSQKAPAPQQTATPIGNTVAPNQEQGKAEMAALAEETQKNFDKLGITPKPLNPGGPRMTVGRMTVGTADGYFDTKTGKYKPPSSSYYVNEDGSIGDAVRPASQAHDLERAGPNTPGFGITNSVPLNRMTEEERRNILESIQPYDILKQLKK